MIEYNFVRLEKIVVKELFGHFSYEISLNDNISFLIGPNGCGKTTILNMVGFILDPSSRMNLDKFYEIPFDEVYLTFSDGNSLGIKRRKNEDNRIRYFYQKGSGRRTYFKRCLFNFDQQRREAIPFECERPCLLIPDSNVIRDFFWPDSRVFTQKEKSFIKDAIDDLFKPSGKTVTLTDDGEIYIQQRQHKFKVENLSYGEKYMLNTVMYLAALKDRLILIDLPETSMHIEWQERFADLVDHLCQENNLQVVITTHSPSIINGHFEWYAERNLTDKWQNKVAL